MPIHLKQKKHQDSKISFGMDRRDSMPRLALVVRQFNCTLWNLAGFFTVSFFAGSDLRSFLMIYDFYIEILIEGYENQKNCFKISKKNCAF